MQALVIVGPPGGGKHELADALSMDLLVPLVDAGRIVSELGDPEDSELALRHEVQDRLEAAALAHETVVVEGFPRTLAQLCVLESLPGLSTSYFVVVSDLRACIHRIAARKRAADHPDLVAQSMRVFVEQTMLMLQYLPTRILDGSTGCDNMLSRVLKDYERNRNGARR